ncbi:MAG: tRNA epoxyqueuosine(34) reductase QueG [Candidatus Kapaibacterium sp.]
MTTDAIKQAALEIGFDAVAIARAEPLDQEIERYRQWLESGYHGAMGYMERNLEARHDVRNIVEGARSVIVVAKNYFTPHKHDPASTGKIARYAWGDDYHVVLPPMLDALCATVGKHAPGSVSRRYTDTGPVLEKQWAVRSGLGWQGKNGNILRRDIGSWFFIGVVITTADLQPDTPMDDFCGSCTACLDACPTKAIIQPAVVDATQCISYWTIETKADVEIPLPIAENLDGWLFGCDVCQDVCPWNRFETPTTEERFQPRHGELSLDPASVLTLQPDSFVERFRHSPLKRPKLGGLQRNARALVTSDE